MLLFFKRRLSKSGTTVYMIVNERMCMFGRNLVKVVTIPPKLASETGTWRETRPKLGGNGFLFSISP